MNPPFFSFRYATTALACFFLCTVAAAAQTPEEPPLWSLEASALAATLRPAPGLRLLQHEIHPGLSAGVQRRLGHGPKHTWLIGGRLGFFHHPGLQNGLWLTPELTYRRHLFQRLSADLRVGAGYLHSFPAGPVYGYDDGRWQEMPNSGSPRFLPSLGLQLSYRLGAKTDSPSLLASWTYAPEIPSELNYHQFWGLGLAFHPF